MLLSYPDILSKKPVGCEWIEKDRNVQSPGSSGKGAVLPAPESRENLIVALVVSEAPAEKLNRLLQTKLDAVAMPRRIVCVDSIPTTAVGKRDNHAALELLGYSASNNQD